jgi:hypothetical protein
MITYGSCRGSSFWFDNFGWSIIKIGCLWFITCFCLTDKYGYIILLNRNLYTDRYSHQVPSRCKCKALQSQQCAQFIHNGRCLVHNKHDYGTVCFLRVKGTTNPTVICRQLIYVYGPTVWFRCQKFDNTNLLQLQNLNGQALPMKI